MAGSAKKRKTWREKHGASKSQSHVPAIGRSNIDTIAIEDFAGLHSSKPIVPKSRWTTRLWHLDLALPLRRKTYDKRAGRITIAEFRRLYFGERKRMTKQRCEKFFSDDANFVTI
jgi:hypothetical protein